MSMPYPLRMAILYWKSGRPAPLHIEMALVDMGFELYTLESKYRR